MKIILVDDHDMVRGALQRLLDSKRDIEVLGTAATPARGITLIRQLQPDVAVFDLDFPEGSALEVLLSFLPEARKAGVEILVCSYRAFPGEIQRLVEAGLKGYVTKSCSAQELIHGLRTLQAGGSYFCARSGTAAEQQRAGRKEATSSIPRRQRDVLLLAAEGHSTEAIAAQMKLSAKTVENYRSALLKRLGAENLTHAVTLARQRGLL